MKRLKKWWYVWRKFGVTPWQYEADLRAVKQLKESVFRAGRVLPPGWEPKQESR